MTGDATTAGVWASPEESTFTTSFRLGAGTGVRTMVRFGTVGVWGLGDSWLKVGNFTRGGRGNNDSGIWGGGNWSWWGSHGRG